MILVAGLILWALLVSWAAIGAYRDWRAEKPSITTNFGRRIELARERDRRLPDG